jgi:hypothetical protein
MKVFNTLVLALGGIALLSGTAMASDIQAPITSHVAAFVKLNPAQQKEALTMTTLQNFEVIELYRYRLDSAANYAANLKPAVRDMDEEIKDAGSFIRLYGKKMEEASTTLQANLTLAKQVFQNKALSKTIDSFEAYLKNNGKKTIHNKTMPTAQSYQQWQAKITVKMQELSTQKNLPINTARSGQVCSGVSTSQDVISW